MTWVTAATAAGLFTGTNLDDIVMLAALNAAARTEKSPRVLHIWAGQYLGVTVLVIVSLLAARGLAIMPEDWVWVLGAIPLLIGMYKLVAVIRVHGTGQSVPAAATTGLIGVAGLTIANGGDNIAAYTPVFRTLGAGDTAVTVIVFAVGVAVWCLVGSWLVSHRMVVRVVRSCGYWIVPMMFIVVGLSIVHRGGATG
ncbi:MAG: cadmium resistance transporter [Kutzneria sp.]|nr:cadmium resistance transporter [Kutzneria sp.]